MFKGFYLHFTEEEQSCINAVTRLSNVINCVNMRNESSLHDRFIKIKYKITFKLKENTVQGINMIQMKE